MSAGTEGSVLTGEKLQEDQHYWLQRLHGGVPPSGLRLDYRRPQDLCPRTASVRLEISGEPYANLLKLTNSQPFLEYLLMVLRVGGLHA